MTPQNDEYFMKMALEEAKKAAARDEVPIGAVLVEYNTNKIVSAQGNRTIELADPTAHAEILTIREECKKLDLQRLPEYDLYVTLEPCTMCAAAISFARIRRLVISALDEKGGGVLHGAKFYEQPTCHHKPNVTHGVLAEECSTILKNFFASKRKGKA